MTCEIEVGGRTRNVEARGPRIFLDEQPLDVDVARVGHAWSLIVGPTHAGHSENNVTSSEGVSGSSRSGRSYEVAVVERPGGDLTVHVNGRPIAVRLLQFGGPQGPARWASGDQGTGGRRRVRPGARAEVARHGPQRVVAPMPGRIAKVLVQAGDVVAARQGLVVVEAMKMENELRSPRAGTVTEVRAVEGALVEANAVLIVIE